MGEEIGHRGMDNFFDSHYTHVTSASIFHFFKLQMIELDFFTKKLKWNSFSYQIKELVYPMVYIQKKFKNSFKVSCNLLISTPKSIPVVHVWNVICQQNVPFHILL